ncbi:hypothetical protein [Spirosoma fluminis]
MADERKILIMGGPNGPELLSFPEFVKEVAAELKRQQPPVETKDPVVVTPTPVEPTPVPDDVEPVGITTDWVDATDAIIDLPAPIIDTPVVDSAPAPTPTERETDDEGTAINHEPAPTLSDN